MIRCVLRSVLGVPALLFFWAEDVEAQGVDQTETVAVDAYSATVSAGKTYACPSNVPVDERTFRFNGTVTTTNPNGVSYQVLIRYGAGGDPAGALEHRDLTTSIGSWAVSMTDVETTLELNVTVTSSQPLDWSAELWGIGPGNVYHIWQMRNNGTLTRDETCEYQIVGIPDLAVTIDRMHPNWVGGEAGKKGRSDAIEDPVPGMFHLPIGEVIVVRVGVANHGDDADDYSLGGGVGPLMTGVDQFLIIVEIEVSHGANLVCDVGESGDSFACSGQGLEKGGEVTISLAIHTVEGGQGGVSVSAGAAGEQNFGDNNDLALIEALPAADFGAIHSQKRVRVPGNGGDVGDLFLPVDGVDFELLNMSGDVVDRQMAFVMDADGNGDIDPMSERGIVWFKNLPPADYMVREVPAEHFEPIEPADGQAAVPLGPGEIVTIEFDQDAKYGMDWGDLPELYIGVADSCGARQCYPTLPPNGAAHVLTQKALNPFEGLTLGGTVDADPTGRPTSIADGDDSDGQDDEWDYSFDVNLVPGGESEIVLRPEVPDDIDSADVAGWIDFNDDGVFQYEERIVDVSTDGSTNLTVKFFLPADATTRFARLRIAPDLPDRLTSPDQSRRPDEAARGIMNRGEVEDFMLGVTEVTDFGDAPENMDPTEPDIPFGYPTTLASNGARHKTTETTDFRIGARVDGENDGVPTILADGDDNANLYDEDGIRFAEGFVPFRIDANPKETSGVRITYGVPPGITATIIPLPERDGKIDGWFDFDGNGNWSDAADHVIDNITVQTAPLFTRVPVGVPASAKPGWTFARFRFSSVGGLDYIGAIDGGEVEDYLLRILPTSLRVTALEDSGPGSLRQRIEEANATDGTDTQYIVYDPVASSGKTSATIVLQSALPTITNPVVVSGGGQLVLDGSQAGDDADGLVFAGGSSGVHGVAIQGFARHGVHLASADNVVSNSVIRENGGDGVHVGLFRGNRILSNQISGNGTLGIDIGGDGPSVNDDGELDGVPNHPVITSVVHGSTTIEGTLSSTPDSEFLIQFFTSESCDASGYGEADTLIAATQVVTDGVGEGTFKLVLERSVSKGVAVVATATGPDGTSEFSECGIATRVERDPVEAVPESFRLGANYPNPFSAQTTIPFDVPETGPVKMEIFNGLGRIVDVLVDASFSPGRYRVLVNAATMASGVYYYRLVTASGAVTRKMIVVK